MAKKGGVQQLQAEINNDEEFEKFIERPGLLVLDIYSEWCGPCLGMVGSLRKIKLELGGDNLQLAICRADGISYLNRFAKKSEPTWMFIVKGKSVNLMFGTDVPKLMRLITQELGYLDKKMDRTLYAITDLQPEEVIRRDKKEFAAAEAIRIEWEAKEKKRRDYLNYVTDTILENMLDMGVTIYGPQVSRDMYKKVAEPAEAMRMQCKDRKVAIVHKADFHTINYACPNPLPDDVLEQLDGQELLLCFWKMPDDNRRPVENVLQDYAVSLTAPRIEVEDFTGEVTEYPPILETMKVKVDVEVKDGEDSEDEVDEEELNAAKRSLKPDEDEEEEEGEEEEGEDEDEGEGEGGGAETDYVMDMERATMFGLDFMDEEKDGEEEEEEEEPEDEVEDAPTIRTKKVIVRIPPVWVGGNSRTHAALIYVYFRHQTTPFLPPDPIPDPPCVIMAFEAYKKKDLVDMVERHKENVPCYGFFTSDEAEEAKFIANSTPKYMEAPKTSGDKLVMKVNKANSHMMLSLATYGPSYVSPNTVIGEEEAKRFFPSTYKTRLQEIAEAAEQAEKEEEGAAKKKKGRKSKDSYKEEQAEDAPAQTPTTSGEESGDSMPPQEEAATAAGEATAAAAAEGEAPATAEGEAPAVEAAPTETEAAAAEAPPAEAAAEAPPEAAAEAPAEPPAETEAPPPAEEEKPAE